MATLNDYLRARLRCPGCAPPPLPRGVSPSPGPAATAPVGPSHTCRMSNIWTMDEGGWDWASSSESPSFTFSRTRSRKPSRDIWRMVSSWPWREDRGQGSEVRACWERRQPRGAQDKQWVQEARMGQDKVSAELGVGARGVVLPESKMGPRPSQ